MKTGLVFDFDGTLADTRGCIVEAMRLAYAEHGLSAPDAAAVVASVGLTLPMVVRAGRSSPLHAGSGSTGGCRGATSGLSGWNGLIPHSVIRDSGSLPWSLPTVMAWL